jgi:hypothetical protein
MTPAVVLLIAAGVVPVLTWLAARWRPALAVPVALLLVPVGTAVYNTAFPYGRAEVAAASRFVLAERRPGDAVWGNSWEQIYYFRHLGEDFIPAGQSPVRPPLRLWLVVTAATLQDREVMLHATAPDGWEWVRRREFYRTSVLLLQPRAGELDQ